MSTLSWAVALRFALSPLGSLSYVSKLAFIGLIVSTGVLLLVISVVNGFDRELRERVLAVNPHFTVSTPSGFSELDLLEDLPGNGIASAVAVAQTTVILAANNNLATASLVGVDAEAYAQVSDVGTFLLSDRSDPVADASTQTLSVVHRSGFGMVIGRTLARRLGITVGDAVVVMLAQPTISVVGAIPRQKRFAIVDVFDSASQLDNQGAFISLANAQRLMQLGNRSNAIHGRLTELFDFAKAGAFLSAQFTDQVSIRSWMSTYGNLYQAIAVQKTTLFALFLLLIGVAAFNLISSLMMLVEHHRGDIAILRSMGATNRQIIGLFCSLGLLLGIGGIVLGLCLGSTLAWSLEALFPAMQSIIGTELMTQYFISYLPVDVRWIDVVAIFVVALSLSFVASVYPAWRASKLLPSRVLAHE
ncbi:MAG: FtsX-like permease family protein [Pseudomonadota bacterium]|nr:FtsX-like permease family protein [Pseudomonadota bacterium]